MAFLRPPGEKRQYLADKFTPLFLMGLCDGLTGYQAAEVVRLFIGQRMRIRGTLYQATPNPAFGTAGVTLVFEGVDWKKGQAFLTFTRNLDELAKVPRDGLIHAEGRIKSISFNELILEDCSLTDPHMASILEVGYQADELRAASEAVLAERRQVTAELQASIEDLNARQKAEREQPPDPEPSATKADKRKNLATGEMQKFCKLLLDGWPSTTERVAHAKAVAFFPENKVPKHAFLDIFRSIRGDKKPGPQPKTRQLNR